MADTICEGYDLESVRSVGVVSASLGGGVHDRKGRCSGLCSLGRRGLRQPLWWRARQVGALLWPPFDWFAWDHPATVVAETTGEGADLAFVRLVGVGPASHRRGGLDR
jgi:hypothetical protein